MWQRESGFFKEQIEAVVQVHRLREVSALAGFTRFEAATPDIDGEYETDVVRAEIASEPSWFPAVENRGEGIFLLLSGAAVSSWRQRREVKDRCAALESGHQRWGEGRRTNADKRPFPGGPYVLLHTLSHLLIQSLALRCGYPAASIRERIYVDGAAKRYGLLLYTASADAEGTLGGLVQQARGISDHLRQALHIGALCSNDPVLRPARPAFEHGEALASRRRVSRLHTGGGDILRDEERLSRPGARRPDHRRERRFLRPGSIGPAGRP